eukprot:515873-Pyramimonas_sp.AAC.1
MFFSARPLRANIAVGVCILNDALQPFRLQLHSRLFWALVGIVVRGRVGASRAHCVTWTCSEACGFPESAGEGHRAGWRGGSSQLPGIEHENVALERHHEAQAVPDALIHCVSAAVNASGGDGTWGPD